jgi:hypothetical protein
MKMRVLRTRRCVEVMVGESSERLAQKVYLGMYE